MLQNSSFAELAPGQALKELSTQAPKQANLALLRFEVQRVALNA
jgi:hypothetical protein